MIDQAIIDAVVDTYGWALFAVCLLGIVASALALLLFVLLAIRVFLPLAVNFAIRQIRRHWQRREIHPRRRGTVWQPKM